MVTGSKIQVEIPNHSGDCILWEGQFYFLPLMAKGQGIFSATWTWCWTQGFIFDSLWQFVTKCDKMRQLFYHKMRQKFITKCVCFFITKCDVYYNFRQYTNTRAVFKEFAKENVSTTLFTCTRISLVTKPFESVNFINIHE